MIDPFKLKEFETYGKMWIPLVEKFGGQHHGYFMPYEGANNIAIALFSFPSLAAYETYRTQAASDPECRPRCATMGKQSASSAMSALSCDLYSSSREA
ncbi:NIPSNAP family protein [Sulfuriferula multivorans]|uniref:NIPSNAP family protein n=1 Tax=Sulfuriferula multivorans TaxID=1559896 RepID=UPI001CB88E8A|nr:NIPSNAP family protein [Sulfuriferula multivorans]